MYDLIYNIIGYEWPTQTTSYVQQIFYISGALIIIFSAVFIDLVYRTFRNFWKSDK